MKNCVQKKFEGKFSIFIIFIVFFLITNFYKHLWVIINFDENLRKSTAEKGRCNFS